MKQVRPFSNGTDAMYWQELNCLKCKKYEQESKCPEDAGCKCAYYLDLGFISGTMPLKHAYQIGGRLVNKDSDYFVLDRKCKLIEQ